MNKVAHVQQFGPITLDSRRVVAVFDKRRNENGVEIIVEAGNCNWTLSLAKEDGADEFMADMNAFLRRND